MISLNGFKVIHSDKVLNALAIMDIIMPNDVTYDKSDLIVKAEFLDVLAINEDGNIISIRDEAWKFQFIPIITK